MINSHMSNRIKLYDVLDNTKNIYMSDNSLEALLDFERVLDYTDLYVFENWSAGELIEGPIHSRYFIECSFMWPYKLMPNPIGAKRLLDYGIRIKMGESELIRPKPNLKGLSNEEGLSGGAPIESKPNKIEVDVSKIWIVTFIIPKRLMGDIERGYIELQGETIDMEDIENAENENLEQASIVPNTEGDVDNVGQDNFQDQPGAVPGQAPGVF